MAMTSRSRQGVLWIAMALIALAALAGCTKEDGAVASDSRGLPPILRYTDPKVRLFGDSGLASLKQGAYDPFSIQSKVLLHDDFSDLSKWRNVIGENKAHKTFMKIEAPECSGGSALRVRPGNPNKGRPVRLKNNQPLAVCMRLKLPDGVELEQIQRSLGVGEFKFQREPDLSALRVDDILKYNFNWRIVNERNGWIDIVQVVFPRIFTFYLILGIENSCIKGLSDEEILIDQVLLRSATAKEAALTMTDEMVPGADTVTKAQTYYDSDGDLRPALMTFNTGSLVLPVPADEKRCLRFGLTFPASMCDDHSQEIRVLAQLEEQGSEKRILHAETLKMKNPFDFCNGWFEHTVEVPRIEKDARITLHCESVDKKDFLAFWGAPKLVFPSTPSSMPNVILISIDTLRTDRVGLYGGYHEEGISPYLDSLAEESLVFENAVAQAPYTLPSHVSMLSGQYPSVHNVLSRQFKINPARTPMLAMALADAGYVTAAFTGGLLVQHVFGFNFGFDIYGERDPCKQERFFARVHSWVEANKTLPFFLFFHTYAAHHRAFDDKEYIDRFDPGCTSPVHHLDGPLEWRQWVEETEEPTEADQRCIDNAYAAGVRMSDDGVRDLLSGLHDAGVLDNTLVIITSDHGEELLEHGKIQHGRTLYEELIRVPLIIRPPGGMTPPKRVKDLVEVLDVPATILDFLNLPPFPAAQGESLCAYLDSTPAASKDSVVYSEVDEIVNLYALRSNDWKIIYNPKDIENETQGYEFFDLQKDPNERNNLSFETPEFDEFRGRFESFRKGLDAMSDSLKGSVDMGGELDPELMEALRQQGYLK